MKTLSKNTKTHNTKHFRYRIKLCLTFILCLSEILYIVYVIVTHYTWLKLKMVH